MPQPAYIIDGYNLLHCFRDLGRLANRDLEAARDGLIVRLAAFRGGKRIRVWVVFDGRGDSGQLQRATRSGVRTIFSGPIEADKRIIQLVRAEKNPGSVTVVSSDRWVKDNARANGADSLGSGRFADMVGAVQPGKGGAGEPEKPEMKPGDVADWEEFFRGGGGDSA